VSYEGSTDPCPGCDGTGWLPGWNGRWPRVQPRPVCNSCGGYGRISDSYFTCGYAGHCDADSPDRCCKRLTDDDIRAEIRERAIAEGKRVYGEHFYIEAGAGVEP